MKHPLHQDARRKGATPHDVAEIMRFRELLKRGVNLANYKELYPEDAAAMLEEAKRGES